MSVELWKPVVGYEGLYEVSDLGRVRWAVGAPQRRKTKPGGFPKTWIDGQGYLRVVLSRPGVGQKIKPVHSLVSRAFLGPCPEGLEVNHKDGRRKDDASVGNLEYVTHKENVRHAHATGLAVVLRGEAHGSARLNELIVRIIRRCVGLGMKQGDVASPFGIDRSLVGHIKTGKLWSHVGRAA